MHEEDPLEQCPSVCRDRLLIVTSGLALLASGRAATEDDPPPPASPSYPRTSELTAIAQASRGVRTAVVRLPQVHDTTKQGLITWAIQIAREKGVSAYVGEGLNRWAASHRLDTARLYRLALEKAETGDTFHAVAEEGVPVRNIAEAIGRGLDVPVVPLAPEESSKHFGWLGPFVGLDLRATSARTRKKLGWNPTGPSLISDLNNMRYSQPENARIELLR